MWVTTSPGVNVLTRMSAIDPIRVDFMVTGKYVLDIVTQTNFKAGQNMEAPFTEFDVFWRTVACTPAAALSKPWTVR